MAMYEREGYCPSNAFFRYSMENTDAQESTMWARTEQLLGDRISYMLYTEHGCNYYGESYVVDCLVGATSTIGIEVACKLESLIPKCEYPEIGKKILITDVINPFQMPGIGRAYVNETECFVGSDELYVLEDERYVVGIADNENEVQLYFFKKEEE